VCIDGTVALVCSVALSGQAERMRRKFASTDDGNRQMVESKSTSRARMTLQNEKNPSLSGSWGSLTRRPSLPIGIWIVALRG
jgi:hypothetical protein